MELKELLEHYEYNNVIIIDDKVRISDDISLEELNQIEGNNLIKSSLPKFGITEISKTRKEIGKQELNEFIDGVFLKEGNLVKLINDLRGFNSVIKLSDLIDMSPIDNIEGDSIWIVDRHILNNDKHIKLAFMKYMEKIRSGKCDVMILYTQDFQDIKLYSQMKNFLEEKLDDNLNNEVMYINAVSKDESITSILLEKFIQRIGKVLVFNLFEEEHKKSLEYAREKIYNNEYYNYLVDYDYLSEGKSAFLAFSEVLFSSNKQSYFKNISSNLDYISKINNISDFKYNLLDDYESFQINQISRFIKTFHQSINTIDIQSNFDIVNDDLHTGDIFKIDEKYFLVIHQDCDIILRENGCRTSDKIKIIEITLNVSPDFRRYIMKRLRKICKSANLEFEKRFPLKSKENLKQDVLQKALDYINSIDNSLLFSVEDISSEQSNLSDIIKYKDKYYEIMLKHKNVQYVDSLLLDCAIYMDKHINDSYIIKSCRSNITKRSTILRLNSINSILDFYQQESLEHNLSFEKYLILKFDIRFNKQEEIITVPIIRIARLPREHVMSMIIEVSGYETRVAIDDIVNI